MWRIKYLILEWITDIWRFLRHIPGYYRLERKQYGYDPETYHFIIQQYEEVLMYITGNRMSKPTYFARDIIALMNDHYCEGCEYKERCDREENEDE
jgi:hypothetical protein